MKTDPINCIMDERLLVWCPVCEKTLGCITHQHLKSHGMTTRQFKEQYPDYAFMHPTNVKIKSEKIAKIQRDRIANDPEFAKEKSRQGKALANFRAGLSKEENDEIQAKSSKTTMGIYTPEQRAEWALAARSIAIKNHPDMCSKGGKAAAWFWKSDEGRRIASERSNRLWASPEFRAAIAVSNLKAVLDGSIHMMVTGRPTKLEREFIELAEMIVPLVYTGDGRLRIMIKNGHRNWRNPDLILPGSSTVVLIDSSPYKYDERTNEEEDYVSVGVTICRIGKNEIENPSCGLIDKLLGLESDGTNEFRLGVPFIMAQIKGLKIYTPNS